MDIRVVHSRTDRRRAQLSIYIRLHKFEFSSPFYSSSAVIFPDCVTTMASLPNALHAEHSRTQTKSVYVKSFVLCKLFCAPYRPRHAFTCCVFARPTVSMRAVNVWMCVCMRERMWTDRIYWCAWINIICRIMVDSSLSQSIQSLCTQSMNAANAATATAAMPMKSSSHVSGFLLYINIYVSFHQSLCHFMCTYSLHLSPSLSFIFQYYFYFFKFRFFSLCFRQLFCSSWGCGSRAGFQFMCACARKSTKYSNITPIIILSRSLWSSARWMVDAIARMPCASTSIQNSNH